MRFCVRSWDCNFLWIEKWRAINKSIDISPRQFKYWTTAFTSLVWGVFLFVVISWFSYVQWSMGTGFSIGSVIAYIVIGLGFIGALANIFLAIYDIINGVWKVFTGEVPKKSVQESDMSYTIEPYAFSDWWNALGSLIFSLIAIPIGMFLIDVAIGPIPDNLITGTDDPVVIWGFAIFWLILSVIALVRGVVGTVKGLYLLIRKPEKRIG